MASVPETPTAWQQRAPGAVAINYLPAAAAVRQPTTPRCKYAALSAPAHPAPPPTRVGVPHVHSPFSSIECIPRHHLKVGKTITTKIKQITKRTRAQNRRVISLSQEATGTNLAKVHLSQVSFAPRRSFKPTPAAPSAPPRRRLHSPLPALSGDAERCRQSTRCAEVVGGGVSPYRPDSICVLPSTLAAAPATHNNPTTSSAPKLPAKQHPTINPILSFNTEFHPRTCSLSPHAPDIPLIGKPREVKQALSRRLWLN